MITQLIAAVIGTIAFSLIFGVPKQYYLYCGLIGGAGWAVYLLTDKPMGATVASFVATMVVIFLSRFAAVLQKCPATIFLIAGIFPLVPGAGVYWTTFNLVNNRIFSAFNTGLAAGKTAFAIVLGIVFVFEIPQSLFIKLAKPFMKTKKNDEIKETK